MSYEISYFCKKYLSRKIQWIIIILSFSIALMLSGCLKKPKQAILSTEPAETDLGQNSLKDYIAVVTGVNTETKELFLYNVSNERNVTLTYTGAVNFVSKNNIQMAAAQLIPGEIIDVYLNATTGRLNKVQVSTETFVENNIDNVLVYSKNDYVSFNNRNFRYRKGVAVFSNNKLIDIGEILPTDVVTIRGTTGYIYSIVVEKGHGYIRPVKYTDFVGGRMIIAGEMTIDVTKKMLVPIREGTYEVTMKKGDFIGTRSIAVLRDTETELDMSIFKNQMPDIGQVVFDISPEGALVYIDKKEVDISAPVTLKYGKHKVFVVLEGYTPYSGTVDVQSANPTVKVDLAAAKVDVDEENKTSSDNTDSHPSPVYDNGHKITVSEPVGVRVYLNGIYKGVAPVNFTKVIGTQTITLSKSGYTTKSYTVEIINDNKNISWKFNTLEKQ